VVLSVFCVTSEAVEEFMAQLNHIGIAVSNLSAVTKLFSLLNLNVSHSEEVLEQGVRTHFIPLPCQESSLELLEPLDSQGAVAQFIQKKGPGVHHLSFLLDNGTLDQTCALLRSEGYKLIYDQPRSGAHEMKINFIHPSSTGGILIELMERKNHS
jgi:methylmalonyl-CoA/ethylmalonyl-CoA epimerase